MPPSPKIQRIRASPFLCIKPEVKSEVPLPEVVKKKRRLVLHSHVESKKPKVRFL